MHVSLQELNLGMFFFFFFPHLNPPTLPFCLYLTHPPLFWTLTLLGEKAKITEEEEGVAQWLTARRFWVRVSAPVLFLWSLHAPHVFVWVSSGQVNFLPQAKHMQAMWAHWLVWVWIAHKCGCICVFALCSTGDLSEVLSCPPPDACWENFQPPWSWIGKIGHGKWMDGQGIQM